MVYITVGSAAYPILEFLDEWGTENFEVRCFCHVLELSCVLIPDLNHNHLDFVGNFSCCYSTSHKNFCQWLLGWNTS